MYIRVFNALNGCQFNSRGISFNKLVALFVFLLSSTFSFSQFLKLTVTDERGVELKGADIYKNNVKIIPNSMVYGLNVMAYDDIRVKKDLYEPYSFRISPDVTVGDTIFKTVVLLDKFTMLEEATVTNSKFHVVYNERNEFIIDYYPLPTDLVLVLKRIKKQNYVQVIDANSETIQYIALEFKPKELERDALGNFHIVSKDSVYQLSIFDVDSLNLRIISSFSSEEYAIYLSDLISLQSTHAIYQGYSHHNQRFNLFVHCKYKKDSLIYTSIDVERFKNASYEYHKAISMYNSSTPEYNNMIALGVWDGNLKTLPPSSFAMFTVVGWYESIVSKPLNVYAYGMEQNIVVLDNVRKLIVHLSYQDNQVVNEIPIDFELSGRYFYDFFYDEMYMLEEDKGQTKVYKLNVYTGALKEIEKIDEYRFAQNIKVSNNTIFFIAKKDNGFNTLMKLVI